MKESRFNVNPVYINRADARRGDRPGFFVYLVEKANIFQRNPVSLALVAMNQLRRRELELYSIAVSLALVGMNQLR